MTEQLQPAHQEVLHRAAVDLDVALEAGVRTVAAVGELPLGLHYLEGQLPGMLFEHHTAGGMRFSQFRPDKPTSGGPKYIQEAGFGGGISIHPRMRRRLRSSRRAAIVEGTKQHLAVISNVTDPSLLVGGMQGCWGWSAEKRPSDDFREFMDGVEHLTVFLDADVATKANVWEAGQRLRDAAVMFGAKQVQFVALPASGNTGIDDLLGSYPQPSRARILENLISTARPLSGRKPAAKSKPRDTRGRVTVDWERASIGTTVPSPTPDATEKWDELMAAAIRIERIRSVADDLVEDDDREIENVFDIRFTRRFDGEEKPWTAEIRAVPYKKLKDLDWLLNQVPNGRGVSVARRPGRIAQEEIVQAILETAPEHAIEHLRRTGLVARAETGGRPGYTTPAGTVLADGFTDSLRSHLTRSLRQISLPDTSQMSDSEVRAAFAAELDFHQYFARDEVPLALTGALVYSLTGAPPRGSIMLVGQFGGGKTWSLRWIGSHVSTKDEPMVVLNGTTNSLADAGAGLEHIIATIDDSRVDRSEKKTEEVLRATSELLRFGGDGPKARRSRLTKATIEGTYEEAIKSRTWMYILGSAESLDSGPGSDSTNDRTLSIAVSNDRPILAGEHLEERLSEYQAFDTGRIVTALTVRYLLAEAEKQGHGDGAEGIALLREQTETVRSQVAERIRKRHPEIKPRGAGVAAAPIVGWSIFLQAAIHYGAVSEADAKRRATEAFDLLAAVAREHHQRWIATAENRWIDMIYRLKALIASGAGSLGDSPGVRSIGKRAVLKKDETEVIAILPGEAARLLGTSREISAEDVRRALEPVAITDRDGNVTRIIRINGDNQRAICIPVAAWYSPESLTSGPDSHDPAQEAVAA